MRNILVFHKLKLVILVTVLTALQTLAGQPQDDEALEFEDILPEDPRGYDKMAPPRGEVDGPTLVHFHVTVMSLDSIDEGSMTYAADIFFAQSWKDGRLRLPDNMTQPYRLLPVQWLKDIWRPDSFFKNAKDVTFQEMTIPNHYIWLYKDKTILYMVKLTLVLSCAMNFKLYPHDTQECTMKIESLSHTTADLVFVWDPEVPLVVDESIELPQLDLVRNVTGDCTQVYSTGNFTCLEVVFTFRRRLGYYLFHTYIPTCLIVIMSWISFWIRPEAVPARITLGVTSLLTLATQHANSQKSLPPVSYIKAIDLFMSSCMIFVFCSLMEYALVNVVLGDVPEEGRRNMTIRRPRKPERKPNVTTNCNFSTSVLQRRAVSMECLNVCNNKVLTSNRKNLNSVTKSNENMVTLQAPNPAEVNSSGVPSMIYVSQPNECSKQHCSSKNQFVGNPVPTYGEKFDGSCKCGGGVLNGGSDKAKAATEADRVTDNLLFNSYCLAAASSFWNAGEDDDMSGESRRLPPTHCGEHIGPCSSGHTYGCIGPHTPPEKSVCLPLITKNSSIFNNKRRGDNSCADQTQQTQPPESTEESLYRTRSVRWWSQVLERRRHRAILIDRVSRVFFPLSFTILNLVYWGVFVIDWGF